MNAEHEGCPQCNSAYMVAFDLLESLGYEPYGTYSGRGMYGKECLAVDVSQKDEHALMFEVGKAVGAFNVPLDVQRALRNPKTDSMGLDIVIYWPDLSESP